MDSKSREALPRTVSMHSHWVPFQSPSETADPTTSNPLRNVSLLEGGYRVAGLRSIQLYPSSQVLAHSFLISPGQVCINSAPSLLSELNPQSRVNLCTLRGSVTFMVVEALVPLQGLPFSPACRHPAARKPTFPVAGREQDSFLLCRMPE